MGDRLGIPGVVGFLLFFPFITNFLCFFIFLLFHQFFFLCAHLYKELFQCLQVPIPYLIEYTSSRSITEVKQSRAWSVLRWVTAWEYQVLQAFYFFFLLSQIFYAFLFFCSSINFFFYVHTFIRSFFSAYKCLRPYLIEYTSSRSITEVKQSRAWSVLRWVTAWEYQVLQAFYFFFLLSQIFYAFLFFCSSINFFFYVHTFIRSFFSAYKCLRPYLIEYTSSRSITEVKQSRAWSVLRWVTAWEYQVLQAFYFFFLLSQIFYAFLFFCSSINFFFYVHTFIRSFFSAYKCLRPYLIEYTSSRSITELIPGVVGFLLFFHKFFMLFYFFALPSIFFLCAHLYKELFQCLQVPTTISD